PRPAAAGADRRPLDFLPPAGVVHHRPGGRHLQPAGQGGLAGRRRGPVRDQRGLRRGGHGPDPRAGHPARQDQRQRWRLRPGSSHRRDRRPAGGDPGQRAAQARPEEGCGRAVHRRRRGYRYRSGNGVIVFHELFTKLTCCCLTAETALSSCWRRAIARCPTKRRGISNMSINKLLIALALGLALAACSNSEQAQDAAAAADTAAAEAQAAADAAAAEGSEAADAAQVAADSAAAAADTAADAAASAEGAATDGAADAAADTAEAAADVAEQAKDAAEEAKKE